MTNFIPIFPLGIVVYPGELLNLHIFEPRYKQMILECREANRPFGIPSVIDNRMQDHGTMVRILEITSTDENGEMDIKTEGEQVFRILEVIKEVPDKLFSGAIVNYPQNDLTGHPEVMRRLVNGIREMHKLLQIEKDFKKPEEDLTAYDLAHHAGMTAQEEYELLCLFQERQRQEYLKRHLAKVLPLIAQLEELKKKTKLNGHFKNLSGFNLDI